jgi:hypothetical protein
VRFPGLHGTPDPWRNAGSRSLIRGLCPRRGTKRPANQHFASLGARTGARTP